MSWKAPEILCFCLCVCESLCCAFAWCLCFKCLFSLTCFVGFLFRFGCLIFLNDRKWWCFLIFLGLHIATKRCTWSPVSLVLRSCFLCSPADLDPWPLFLNSNSLTRPQEAFLPHAAPVSLDRQLSLSWWVHWRQCLSGPMCCPGSYINNVIPFSY